MTSGQLLREGGACGVFQSILSNAARHRGDLVDETIADMRKAEIPYVDDRAEAKIRMLLLSEEIMSLLEDMGQARPFDI